MMKYDIDSVTAMDKSELQAALKRRDETIIKQADTIAELRAEHSRVNKQLEITTEQIERYRAHFLETL